MKIIKGIEHYTRIEFILDHQLLPPRDIAFLFEMNKEINPANFRAYHKVAQCAKESELEQLKADKLTFAKLYTMCEKRKNNASNALLKAKKLIAQYVKVKRELQTGIHPQSFNNMELRALKKAVEVYELQELIKNLSD
jgi:hypothetical protein